MKNERRERRKEKRRRGCVYERKRLISLTRDSIISKGVGGCLVRIEGDDMRRRRERKS